MDAENSITFTMAEFGQFQEELLSLKHENARLKAELKESQRTVERLEVERFLATVLLRLVSAA